MKTTIILYFIGLVITYLMVGIHNKIAIKHSVIKLSSWWVLGSLLSITIFMAVLAVSFVFAVFIRIPKALNWLFELLKKIEIQKIVFNAIAVAFKWLYKSIILSFKWIFETIKKSKSLVKWFIRGVKKLHFALIPPEKGVDLLLKMFSNLFYFIIDNAFVLFILIISISIISGFILIAFMIEFGVFLIIVPFIIIVITGLILFFYDM